MIFGFANNTDDKHPFQVHYHKLKEFMVKLSSPIAEGHSNGDTTMLCSLINRGVYFSSWARLSGKSITAIARRDPKSKFGRIF